MLILKELGCAKAVENVTPKCHTTTKLRMLGDLLFEFREEVEGVEGFELVQVSAAEFLENLAVESREEDLLISIAALAFG